MNEELSIYKKDSFKGLLCILFYLLLSSTCIEVLRLLNVNFNEMSNTIKIIYALLIDFIIMLSILIVMNKKITRDFKNLLKNYKIYFKKYFKFWLISVGVMIISNLIIIQILGIGSTSGNERALREIFKISPLYIFISSVIIAPITEELVFRQSIRNLISNKVIFIIVSGLVFGALHVATDFKGPLDLLYLIPYCTPGFAFAYILADSDNIWISTFLHFMHNGIIVSIQLLALLFI